MITEPARNFSRMFRGYQPAAVDAHIEMLNTKQQLLLDDVESLRAKLKESGDEAATLRKEVALLTETSPSPHAVQQRLAKMLRQAVDEVSELRAEAQAEAAALSAKAKAEAEAEQQKHKELLADLCAQLNARQAEYDEAKATVEAELDRMSAENQSAIDAAWQDAQQEREQLLADAKLEADHYREQARRAVEEASQQRIEILERLTGVYRDLEGVPATLDAAYREFKNATEASAEAASNQKISTG
ncbi:MAG TPA: cell division protein DivIVA [Mycobacterium sp.]|nr:cell division protein DivIVA [Mycobacterium sp.]